MKAPRMTRLLSLFLALIFCVYLVPTEVWATELKTDSDRLQNAYIDEATSINTADVVSEIVSSRDKYQKEYVLSNGLRLLTVYPTAVHYEDENGQWQEIDNTLKMKTVSGKRVYQNTSGLWDVTLPSSLSGSNAVSVARDDSVLSFRFAGQLLQDDLLTAELERISGGIVADTTDMPTDETDVDASMEDILTAEPPADEFEAIESFEDVSVPDDTAQQDSGEPESQTATLSLTDTPVGADADESEGPVAEPNEEAEADKPAEDASPAENPASEPNNTTTESTATVEAGASAVTVPNAQRETATTTRMGNAIFGRTATQVSPLTLKDSEVTFSEKDKTIQQTFSDKLSSAAEYSSVFNGVNVRYDLTSNRLKESIIISAAPANRTGYQYFLDTENLELELQADNSIYAFAADHADGDEPVFYMPAPYMYDQNMAYCDDIDIVLTGTEDGYTLTYLLPQEWMAADDRAYPVVLDPVVDAELGFTNIADQTVFSITQLSYTWAMLCIGQGSYGIGRSFLKYNNLPTLTSADVIVQAQMSLYKLQTSSTTSEIDVHKVNSTWESSTINWNNKPDYDTTVKDYQVAGALGWYTWDVTDIAQGWYEGDNTGMMFKMEDSQEAAATDLYREFCSSDYASSTLPTLSIAYINNCGLENIWDYTSHSAGAAGTGYINDYTGNLVWVYNGLSFSGNRMPVAINHVYNANDKSSNTFGMGYGWRTNYNQLVYQWSTNSSYYVWEDEDGTRHYFKYKSSGTYEDEVNTGLILTTTGSGTTKYCITDKSGNKSYFDTSGRLTKISNNQATTSSVAIAYSSGKLISSITDGAGRKYQFNYSGSTLSSITFLGTGSTALATESYTYSSSNLTGISSTILSAASFSYTSNHLLSQAQDADGYKLQYSYNVTNTSQPNRIVQVKEYDGSTAGGSLYINYAHNQTIFTDHNGNQEIVQFNNYGSTVSVQDGEGRAQFYKYSSNSDIGKASQLAVSSKLQNTVTNKVRNSSFEQTGFWTASSGNASTGSWSYASSGYIGSKSLAITRTANSGVFCVQSTETAYCPADETFTLSAYIKTSGMSGGGLGAQLALMSSGTVIASSSAITTDTDWTRVELTYTNTTGSVISSLTVGLRNGTSGTAYFDCVQLEKTANASRYNLIDNGDFNYNSSMGWTKNSACTSADGYSVSYYEAPTLSDYCLGIQGAASKDKQVSQTVTVSGSAGDVFSVAGWANGDSVPITADDDRQFAIRARFNYTNGTTGDTLIDFNTGADNRTWQYAAGRIVAGKAYSSITISLLYSYNANMVYFDGIQLFKEEFGHSYVYDSDGNVTSVTDLQKKTTTYEYSNNNLTKMTLPSGASQTYTYDSYHNVLSATSPEGVVSNFTYDTYGNNTKVTVGGGTKKITATATYTSNGDQLSTVTDALGQTTSYGYDTQTGVLNWTQAPGETTATRTNYSHDSRYRTTEVSKGDSGVDYTYSSDLLSALSSASGTEYSFAYGVFDLIDSVSIGNRTLISHTYSSDANRWLTRSDYGNGDYITYSYDDLGRTSSIGYEDNATAVSYTYDNNGNLGILTDSITNRKTKYLYDFQDRLMRYEETGSGHTNIVQWGYDDENNLSSQTQILNGTTYATNYSYDDDNRLTQATSDGKSANYTYDAYSRMTKLINKNGSSPVVTTDITYKNPTSATTSTQVYKWTVGGTTYTYTYDARGNITAISDGTNTTSYVYDSLDQLTRENNQAAGKTWVYTYDDGGNILSKKEYAYITGTLGTALDTISYGYGDSAWKDLLTSYNGQTLTSDAIGNLTNDGEWTYTWQHGRQLAQMYRYTDINEYLYYKYDANGNRIGKTYEEVLYYETGSGTTSAIRYPITATYSYSGDVLTYAYILDASERDSGNSTLMHFTYDELGPMSVNYNGAEYFYLKNAQGDVTGLVNTSGTQVVAYTYDAWGNPISTTGSMASTLGKDNPFRYRSYFYDTETGLYYLGSRYYNPETGRFINADSYLSTGQGVLGTAMFSYCNNNPVNACDDGGTFLCTLIGAAVGAVFGYVSKRMEGGSRKEALASAVKGAITGAAAGLVADVAMVTGGTALGVGIAYVVAGGTSNVIGSYVEKKINASSSTSSKKESSAPSNKEVYSWADAGKDFLVGAVLSVPSAITAGAATPMMETIKSSAGKKALQQGITVGDAVVKTISREWHHLGQSIGSEFLGNFGSWYMEKQGGLIVAQFDG